MDIKLIEQHELEELKRLLVKYSTKKPWFRLDLLYVAECVENEIINLKAKL